MILILVILLMLFMFAWGKVRYDLVAFGGLLLLTTLQIVDVKEAFAGFAHPATITVGIVLIMSHILTTSGATLYAEKILTNLTLSANGHMLVLCLSCAILSAFINNVGALAIFMPIAVQTSIERGRHPGEVLMPLSFASLLGGLATQVGTPPNIIIASYRQNVSGAPFSLFDFAPVGAIVAIVGIIFICFLGWRAIKKRRLNNVGELFDLESYISELTVVEETILIDQEISVLEDSCQVIGYIRGSKKYLNYKSSDIINRGDIIIIEASPKETQEIINKFKLEFTTHEDISDFEWFEAVVTPNSSCEGKTIRNLRKNYNANILAVASQGKKYQTRLDDITLRSGDVFLIHGEADHVQEILSNFNCLPLAGRSFKITSSSNSIKSVALFLLAIGVSITGVIPVHIALGLAIIVSIVLNILPIKELYQGVDGSVIVLIGCMIPIGLAFEQSGVSNIIAQKILLLAGHIPIEATLLIFMITTVLLTDIINNSATALLMAPIAKDLALSLQVNTDTFLMAVAIAASCAFLTPIGHQNNTIIMGPGGYKFSDYWRLGLPLLIIVLIVSLPCLLYFWPL